MRKELGISTFRIVEIIISIVCLKKTSYIICLCIFGFYFCVTSLTKSYFHFWAQFRTLKIFKILVSKCRRVVFSFLQCVGYVGITPLLFMLYLGIGT